MPHIAVVGASGFVGGAVCRALETTGYSITRVRAPRVQSSHRAALRAWEDNPEIVDHISAQIEDTQAVICAAGIPDASSRDENGLYGANAALPNILAAAASHAGVPRVIHVSSAVVQGFTSRLDANAETSPTSPYGRSKALGELAVGNVPNARPTVVYRPPSVHAPNRRITRAIFRIANSPLASVIAPEERPTPQAHITNVASAITHLATCVDRPPPIVIHPWEGWTTASFLQLFANGKPPRTLPSSLAPISRSALKTLSGFDLLAPTARRLEMLWLGQEQDASWLTDNGWVPPVGVLGWQQLVQEVREATLAA